MTTARMAHMTIYIGSTVENGPVIAFSEIIDSSKFTVAVHSFKLPIQPRDNQELVGLIELLSVGKADLFA